MGSREFLPVCDILFNLVSMAAYFCDVVFDAMAVYSLYLRGDVVWSFIMTSLIILAQFSCQILSLKWHIRRVREASSPQSASRACNFSFVVMLHVLQLGILWRYFMLFLPVDLSYFKHDIRDLCVLRLVHGFCEAAPLLLVQLYLLLTVQEADDLRLVAAALSLFSVCWALASFNKNVRRKRVHRLVMTWLGVLFQFFWHLGTVISRVLALTLYATILHYWVLVVLFLHWFVMLLWLVLPKNVFQGEKISRARKLVYSSLIAVIYTFCYINLQDAKPRLRIAIFYAVMFLENILLLSIWMLRIKSLPVLENGEAIAGSDLKDLADVIAGVAVLSFFVGLAFMGIYYRFFHVTRLKHALSIVEGMDQRMDSKCLDCQEGVCSLHQIQTVSGREGWSSDPSASDATADNSLNRPVSAGQYTKLGKKKQVVASSCSSVDLLANAQAQPTVFNCRLNQAIKRKKKKPSSFIPPPHDQDGMAVPVFRPPVLFHNRIRPNTSSIAGLSPCDERGKMIYPWWFNPLPYPTGIVSNRRSPRSAVGYASGSDTEGSVVSRMDIQRKLAQKKEQQLVALRMIEEEIAQGKLQPPPLTPASAAPPLDAADPTSLRPYFNLANLPPLRKLPPPPPHYPKSKKQPWLLPDPPARGRPESARLVYSAMKKQRSKTPEVLLSPHHLDNTRVYYDGPSPGIAPPGLFQEFGPSRRKYGKGFRVGRAAEMLVQAMRRDENEEFQYEQGSSTLGTRGAGSQHHPWSDGESQVSFPGRSFTLPREFRYYRKPRHRKALMQDSFLWGGEYGGDSSDGGDADSEESEAPAPPMTPTPLPTPHYHPAPLVAPPDDSYRHVVTPADLYARYRFSPVNTDQETPL